MSSIVCSTSSIRTFRRQFGVPHPQRSIIILSERALLPNEQTDPAALTRLFHKIVEEGLWTQPVLVEKQSLTIMDGHHRLAVARLLGLRYVPVLLYSYDDVTVEGRRGRRPRPEEIIQRGMAGALFPAKTTRHLFPATPLSCSIKLNDLN